jgi:hypothetical protein
MFGYAGVFDHASMFNNVDPTLSNKTAWKAIASAERVYNVTLNTLWVVAFSIQKTAGAAATAGHVRHRCVFCSASCLLFTYVFAQQGGSKIIRPSELLLPDKRTRQNIVMTKVYLRRVFSPKVGEYWELFFLLPIFSNFWTNTP